MPSTTFIFAGPSGSGKTSVVRGLCSQMADLTAATTVTTREPRIGEIDGLDYDFVSVSTFLLLQKSDYFFECENVFSEMYGTPRQVFAPSESDTALIVTPRTALLLKERVPKVVTIYVKPASREEAARRVLSRCAPNQEARLAMYEADRQMAHLFDYTLAPDSLTAMVAVAARIIHAHRAERAFLSSKFERRSRSGEECCGLSALKP